MVKSNCLSIVVLQALDSQKNLLIPAQYILKEFPKSPLS